MTTRSRIGVARCERPPPSALHAHFTNGFPTSKRDFAICLGIYGQYRWIILPFPRCPMLPRLVVVVFLVFISSPSSAQPIMLGQKDDFQDGTTQNWTNGPSFPDPVNVPTGGPTGAGDRYLRVTSGGLGLPPRIVAFNVTQWTGNYISAGVTKIEVDLLNLTQSSLSMRWGMRVSSGPNFTPGYVSTAFTLPADNAWHHAVFLLDEANLIPINGPPSLSTFLTSVGEARILHSVAPSLLGDLGNFQFGMDNVLAAGAAVPEPTTWVLLGFTACCLQSLRRRRAPQMQVENEPPSEDDGEPVSSASPQQRGPL
jgi:hypothetical protein